MAEPNTGTDQLIATGACDRRSRRLRHGAIYLHRIFHKTGENSAGYSPSLSPLPPSCLSLARTALTSSSLGFFSGSPAVATSASLRAVVSAAGNRVAPVSTGAGFSLLARCTSR